MKFLGVSVVASILLFGCGSPTASVSTSSGKPTYAELTGQLRPIFDWGAFASDGYQDSGLTTQVSNGSIVNAFKTFGNSRPTTNPNLFRVTPDYVVANIWHGNQGVTTRYYEDTDYDRYMDIHNALGHSYESNPGTIPGGDGYNGNLELVYGFRLWHGVFDESIGLGLKWRGNKTFDYYGQNGEVFTSAVIMPKFGTDYLLRVKYVGTSVRVFLNDDEIITGTLNANFNMTEFNIGTNSHPLAHHFRFWGIKKGALSASELDLIKSVTNTLWPRDGTLPSFPYITGISTVYYQNFNSTTNTWTLPSGTNHLGTPIEFKGGSGTPGTHLYQWYYAQPSLGVNTIDLHFPLAGATGPVLDRDDYKGAGQPFNGHEGDAHNIVFCVVTPVDSNGVQGRPIITDRYQDNVP